MAFVQGLLGIVCFLGVAVWLSSNRKHISWRLVLYGFGLQWLLALLVLGVPRLGFSGPLKFIFSHANEVILSLLRFTQVGSEFVFGDLAQSESSGFILAFQILPIIIFISSLMTLLYHLGVMQKVVSVFAWLMQKTLGLSGAESLAAAANVFIGQTEAPLLVKPYLKTMTRSEIFCLMTGGMATIAGSVMAAYVGLLQDVVPNIGAHLLTASVLASPMAIVIAKILEPETETPETLGALPKNETSEHVNAIEAAAHGAGQGLNLALNVAAMLLAFIALIALGDALLIQVGEWVSFSDWAHEWGWVPKDTPLSLTLILSVIFQPVAFAMGLPWGELSTAASLIGKKVVFNEFLAYLDLAQLQDTLSPRSLVILSYGLCGFANFSSIAIQLGGIGPLIPERRGLLARFGVRAVIGGNLTAFITASLAGLLI